MGFIDEAARTALENTQDDRAYRFLTVRIRGLRARGEDHAAAALLADAIRDLRHDHVAIDTLDVVDFSREALVLGRIDMARDLATLERHSFSRARPRGSAVVRSDDGRG